MGMFDYFRCEAPLPGPKPAVAFQTKDLECYMERFVLTAEGALVREEKGQLVESPFTAVVNFYEEVKDAEGGWVSYLAFIYRGRLIAPIMFAPDHGDPHQQSSGRQPPQPEVEAMAALMRARLTEAPIPGAPEVGSVWRHHSGRRYTVVLIANQPDNDRYPVTVVYQGENGKVWARPASDWDRSMMRVSGEGV